MNNFTPSYLVFVADLNFFKSTVIKYKKDALSVKGTNFSNCTPSFHLLSSLAFELFPKILIGYKICLKHKKNKDILEEDIRKEISAEMKKHNHHLANLYKDFPNLLQYLEIDEIFEFKNGFVWDYRIKFKNKEILIKDVEAIRYGSFAKNKDITTYCIDDNEIINLLNKIELYIELQEKEVNAELVKYFI